MEVDSEGVAPPPLIKADPRATVYLKARGGALYVWMTGGGRWWGLSRQSLKRPRGHEFRRVPGDGFDLFIDERIDVVGDRERWTLNYYGFPRRRVRALYGEWQGSG